MDIPWGDPRTKKFITNVGLITTDGPAGPNIMAAEWTHMISYEPGLIAICISNENEATAKNIKKTKEFGVSITSTAQSILSSTSGKYSGTTYDKISAAKELGFTFFKAKKIKTLMVEGAALNIECKLVKAILLGSHTMFVGEAVYTNLNEEKEPIAFHGGRYGSVAYTIEKPSEQERARIAAILEKHKKAKGKP